MAAEQQNGKGNARHGAADAGQRGEGLPHQHPEEGQHTAQRADHRHKEGDRAWAWPVQMVRRKPLMVAMSRA